MKKKHQRKEFLKSEKSGKIVVERGISFAEDHCK
jgi:hypothetical protein